MRDKKTTTKKKYETNKPKPTLIRKLQIPKTHIRNISFSSLMENGEKQNTQKNITYKA